MINLKKYTLGLEEFQYRNLECYSYSKIASFEKEGPQAIKKKDFTETTSMMFGKIVDTLITCPKEFDARYSIINEVPTNDKVILACKALVNEDNLTDENILKVLTTVNYYPKWRDETRLKSFKSDRGSYLEDLKAAKGKTIISEENFQLALFISIQFEQNKFLKDIFNPKDLFTHDNVEILFQPMFHLKDENLKAMMDFIIINHTTKTITPVDLKMVDDVPEAFLRSFYKFKYYRQAEVYTYILQKILQEENSDYTLNPFKFVVASKKNFKILQYNFEILYNEANLLYVNNNLYPSFKQIIQEIEWHLENEEYMYTREQSNNLGVITIPNCSPELKQLPDYDNIY